MAGLGNTEYYSQLKIKIKEAGSTGALVHKELLELISAFPEQIYDSDGYEASDKAEALYDALLEELDRITAVCEVYEGFENKLYELIKGINLPED